MSFDQRIDVFLSKVHFCLLLSNSFCELTSQFSVQVTDREGKNFLSQIASVAVVTLISTVLLYLNFAKYTKRTLNIHQEDEQEQQRLQELK